MANARVVEESWAEVQLRLYQTQLELLGMERALRAPRPAQFRRHERSLRARLRPMVRWIDRALTQPKPVTIADSNAFVMSLYRLDQLLPRLFDDFHRLLEATGEGFSPV
jgi:hypothetical protein